MTYKQPVSVLVVIHTPGLKVLLIERRDFAEAWQSVTGSRDGDETLTDTARREVFEETGIDATGYALTDWRHTNEYEIFPVWRHRYAPGVTCNTEHVFSLQVPSELPVTLSPSEHVRYRWVDWAQAADMVFSPSNAEAIRALPAKSADYLAMSSSGGRSGS
ncbi:dihydroneopterin triphosphate diphosphatase [Jeongeupia naejangsanensis]|uniref:Dihydroneopterin triphosphate diphosphatase n=1 Tax=Jeongeupia naejangsanensis TaxID=613195 RepID=A0ABS2BJT8_9NEIS|nr:dihydroneopterin triphosphate diphosphatase [Jeongeupia naejangsanensis]MBM3115690.1 dihydroneopterin triphosphate diphosphatase [Jeongeupia naejangsanensis]